MPTAVLVDLAECEACSTRHPLSELVDTAEHERFCSGCVADLKPCAGCDLPVRDNALTTDDDYRCAGCRSAFSVCDDCMRYTRYNIAILSGGDVCESCAEAYSTCDDCNFAVAEPVSINGERDVCEDCRQDYRECDRCETLIRGREDYCDDCYRPDHSLVHDSEYTPRPIFHGNGPLFLGLELELRTTPHGFDDSVETANDQLGRVAYLKHDGSISCGFELVTHPMSYDYAITEFPWSVLSRLRLLGCYTDDEVGIHVHLSRAGFDSPAHIYRWLKLVYRNEDEVSTLARRQDSQWAGFHPDIREKARELAHGGRGWGRYHAINTRPLHTFELRIFASSLQRQQVQAALSFAHASVEYTRTLRAHDVTRHRGWDWATFTAWVATRPEYAALTAELTALGATGSGVSTGNQEDLACAS
ncbi:amidoligase family protein [Nocardia fluminea]